VADGENGIKVFSAEGEFLREIALNPDGYLVVDDLAIAPDGTLWVAESNNQALHHFDGDGNRVEVFQSEYDDTFDGPLNIEIGADGTIFLLDWLEDEEDSTVGSRVRVLDSATVPLAEFDASLPTDAAADDIEIGPDGNLHVLNDGNVRVFDAAGNLVADPLHVLEYEAYEFEVGADGTTYFKIAYGPIAVYDAAGNYLYQYGAPQEDDSLEIEGDEIADVRGMAALPNGDLIVADTNFDYTRLALLSFAGE
jgi:hypothetical protein